MGFNGEEKNLENVLKPLMIVSQVMGVSFPEKILKKRYKLIMLYKTIMLSALVLFLINEIPTMTFWTSTTEGIHGMLAFLETRLRWFAVITNFILNGFSNPKINNVIAMLTEVPITLKHRERQRIFRFQLFVFSSTFMFLVPYYSLGLDVLWLNPYYAWYSSAIYIFSEFQTGVSNIQFVILLFVIKKYFKTLNETLSESKFRSKMFKRSENLMFFVVGNYKTDEVGKIVKLRRIHMTLVDSCLKTNKCFSLQLLMFLVLSLVEITYSFRSAVIFFIDPTNGDTNFWKSKYWLELALIVFWAGYYFWQVLNVIVACEAVIRQTAQTASAVDELINKVGDKVLEKQLQIFSLQLTTHQIYLSAGNFVVLDYPLINSIIGTVITYLVIITTFKN